MHILYIVQHFSGPNGNGWMRPYENPRRLVLMGHQVTLLCGMYDRASAKDIEAAQAANIHIVQIPVAYQQKFSYFRRLLSFNDYMLSAIKVAKGLPKPDLVYASSPPLTVGEIGRVVARHHRVPFVFEVRDLWPEIAVGMGALNNPVLRFLVYEMTRRIYREVDHVVALSPGIRDGIANWGVPLDRITVVSNASDLSMFGHADERPAVRARYGWDHKFVAIYSGAMGLVNGLDYVLDCARVLDRMKIENIHLALFGEGAQRAHLQERIAREGLQSVKLYDAVPKSQIPAIIEAADTGLVIFRPIKHIHSNSANKFFDYLAAGLPIVLNYGGWQEELLQQYGAGQSVTDDDPRALAEALIALRDQPARRRTMGSAARQLAVDQFDRGLLVERLERTLRAVVNQEAILQPSRHAPGLHAKAKRNLESVSPER